MIVVAGEPRSGTSLQMRILKELGFKIAGKKYMEGVEKDFNPTGMWEIEGVTYNGLRKELLDDGVKTINDGKPIGRDFDAIKLTLRGFCRSDFKLIDKLILCIRDPREMIVSQRDQLNHVSDHHNWNLHLGHTCAAWEAPKSMPMLIVDYGDVMYDKEKEIKRVADFVGREVTQAALDIVRPELYRSKKHKAKNNKYAKAAELYYRAFRKLIT